MCYYASNLGNPQSLNLYAYVQNNPVNAVDLDGHQINALTNPGFENSMDFMLNCNASGGSYSDGGCRLGFGGPGHTDDSAPPDDHTAATPPPSQSSTSVTANGMTVTITTDIAYEDPEGPIVGERMIENRTGTHAFRDNNPGNMKAGAFAQVNGSVGTDGVFAVFSSSGAGFLALNALLSGPSYQNLTVDQAIYRYAPPSENDTGAYQTTIRTAVGVTGNTRMSALNADQRGQMAQAIARYEGFYVPGIVETVVIPIFRIP